MQLLLHYLRVIVILQIPHQLDNGKDSVVTATTNNNNNAIIIRRMRVNIVFIYISYITHNLSKV